MLQNFADVAQRCRSVGLDVLLHDREGPTLPGDFAANLRFVLDCFELLAAWCIPGVGQRELPAGLRGSLDPQRVGAFGWLKGGTATACRAFFDDHLRHRWGHLLAGPSPAFQAVAFPSRSIRDPRGVGVGRAVGA